MTHPALMLITIYKGIRRLISTFLVTHTCGSYQTRPIVSYFSRVTRNTHLGRNVSFNGIRIKGAGKVQIGDNFHCGQEVLVITEYHKYDGGNAIPYDTRKTLTKDVIVEENVWVGDRVIILGGVRIGEGAIVQAGSVVVSDIPKYAIAGGHPARPFKSRDVEHYLALKARGAFH